MAGVGIGTWRWAIGRELPNGDLEMIQEAFGQPTTLALRSAEQLFRERDGRPDLDFEWSTIRQPGDIADVWHLFAADIAHGKLRDTLIRVWWIEVSDDA